MYYDPELDEFQERRKAKEAIHSDDPKERLRAEIKRKWRNDKGSGKGTYSFYRIIFYSVIILFTLYLIFFTNFVNHMVSLFLK